MRRLKQLIASHQGQLRIHPLFERLEQCQTREPLTRMARALTWWPMAFQDVLRLNASLTAGSALQHFADHHRAEDAGHDRWFLDDLHAFSVEEPGLDELFGEEYQPIRDACYALLAETYRDQSAAERIVLLFALEQTGHVFFEQVVTAVDRLCPELPLQYFARSHLGVEKDHDLFTETSNTEIEQVVLTDEERVEAAATVARVYGIFTVVFSYLLEQMNGERWSSSHIRELDTAGASEPERNAGGY